VELRALELAEKLMTEGRLRRGTGPGEYRRIRLHRIVMHAGSVPGDRGKLSNDYDFFRQLRDHGREAARQFLAAHFDDIGRRSTMDLAVEPAPEAA
jgi:NTE family protein